MSTVEDDIRLGGIVMGTLHTDTFDDIGCMFTDTGSVDESEQDTVDVEGFFDGVARCTGYVADNGTLFIEQGI